MLGLVNGIRLNDSLLSVSDLVKIETSNFQLHLVPSSSALSQSLVVVVVVYWE